MFKELKFESFDEMYNLVNQLILPSGLNVHAFKAKNRVFEFGYLGRYAYD